jgi:thioredoxin 1
MDSRGKIAGMGTGGLRGGGNVTELAEVDDRTFEAEVLQAGVPVLVEFGAEWCQPCRQLEPILKELAGEWGGRLRVVTLDIDANANTTMRFGIMGVPALLLFVAGQPVEQWNGFQPKRRIVERLSAHLSTT